MAKFPMRLVESAAVLPILQEQEFGEEILKAQAQAIQAGYAVENARVTLDDVGQGIAEDIASVYADQAIHRLHWSYPEPEVRAKIAEVLRCFDAPVRYWQTVLGRVTLELGDENALIVPEPTITKEG